MEVNPFYAADPANLPFVTVLFLLLAIVFGWAFSRLPKEEWQIAATIPFRRRDTDISLWEGMNITYYGFFVATAQAVAVSIMFVLMGAVHTPLPYVLSVAGITLAICVPGSKVLARIVEKKAHTFTVGGASFLGILFLPLVLLLIQTIREDLASWSMPFLAACAVGYAFGEGIGRLACISFGCCYGKPLAECNPMMRRIFRSASFIFSGKTKKISYESGLEGREVLPIQAITSVIYSFAGLTGVYFFLSGFYATTYVALVLTTQVWRFVSETLRADYRGEGRVSAYQLMSAAACVYAVCVAWLLPYPPIGPGRVSDGLRLLWNPAPILSLQAIWAAIFFLMGRSKVTGSTIFLFVKKNSI